MYYTGAFLQSYVWIEELEDAVADAERALRSRDWKLLDEANKRQPRLTHGLKNALEAERQYASPQENLEIDERIQRIVAVRDMQIERLQNFQDDIRKRLIELEKFRRVAQGAAAKRKQTSTFNVVR